MRKDFALLLFLVCALMHSTTAQVFTGRSDMTLSVMNRYLSRSITMAGLEDLQKNASSSAINQRAYNQQIAMLATLNARYIGRVAGMWKGETHFDAIMAATRQTNLDIQAAYRAQGITEMPIAQGAIFEVVTKEINSITVPGDVIAKFYPGHTTARKFIHGLTIYDAYFVREKARLDVNIPYKTSWDRSGDWATVPDMSKPETQMWFYFVATKLIDAGCEALHFGQVEMMDEEDPGHRGWWNMLSLVRQYAATKNRGVVLCDAHTTGLYYDPDPSSPLPTDQRQLLFDLHSSPLRPQEDQSKPWLTAGGGSYLDNLGANCGSPIYNNSKGGKSYLNWGTVVSLPYLVEFDNFGITLSPGQASGSCAPWGWDEISWFGLQTNNYRNAWLKYAYYKVRCLDNNAHLGMPGIRGMTVSINSQGQDVHQSYHASNGLVNEGNFNQETMIRNLWNNVYDQGWLYKDVVQNYQTGYVPNVVSDPVWVGENMYYIGSDKRVHAFIKQGQDWGGTSPSWIANGNGQSIGSQMKASGGLVATPDGRLIIYRGIDNELYAFDIISSYNYNYHKLASGQLQSSEKVGGDLICMDDNHLYYRSTSNQIYAYVRCCGNQWIATSPSWLAHNQININSQVKSKGGLVVNPSHTRLYYTGQDGQLHGFVIDGSWNYQYFDLPQIDAKRGNGQLVCANDNKLFFVDQQDDRVYGVQLNSASGGQSSQPAYGGNWGRISPSYDAQLNPSIGLSEQVKAAGELAISPDGSLLAYIGVDNSLHGFRMTDENTIEYLDFTPSNDASLQPTRGLRFSSATQFCYIAATQYQDCEGVNRPVDPTPAPSCTTYTYPNKMIVGQLIGQLNACNNPSINFIQKPYNNSYAKSALPLLTANQPIHTKTKIQNQARRLELYPNPATDVVRISMPDNAPLVSVTLTDLRGAKVAGLRIEGDQLNVSALAKGIYTLTATDGQKVFHQRFIKQ